ncbi:hypothetical protein DCO58_02385 [Helicobacter saguini]|uniref:HdrB-like C-terminal domain-containing protein n=1 Tax=Helicobacter saguini TaxID=1548018 RepID=A0A347VRU1_9HELI|nr:hypothetical protein [Helicobacter saguini]MWV62775.1 hypothetical protein [Helicobacter saguini]MWV66555.1 hypothetical protein [Helicobacter saguini]MWV68905.1 hypothetical protein [Helicobacter saguini]MWV71541.1 hypothetical protein [Helicobacter saguini]TLD93637.1 hypothetical protein LS64_008390 [Helicobacter saguini]
MFVIYDCGMDGFCNADKKNTSLSSSPFGVASKAVLNSLNIPFRLLDSKDFDSLSNDLKHTKTFLNNGGYYGRIANLSKFLFANIFNIALAAKNGDILLALEEDSYSNLAYALNLLESNAKFKEFLNNELLSQNIRINIESLKNHIAYLPQVLSDFALQNPDKFKAKIKFHFGDSKDNEIIPSISKRFDSTSGFSSAIYYGGRHFDCTRNSEYDGLKGLFDSVELNAFETSFSALSFSHFFAFDTQKAFEKSGEILYSGIDLGVDFLCVFSASSFAAFDAHFRELSRACGRDEIAIPSLNLAQILLLSFGEIESCGFELHQISPLSLFVNDFKVS